MHDAQQDAAEDDAAEDNVVDAGDMDPGDTDADDESSEAEPSGVESSGAELAIEPEAGNELAESESDADGSDVSTPELDSSSPEPVISEIVDHQRPHFDGPPTGIRRGDREGRLVIDTTAAHHCSLGFAPEIVPRVLSGAVFDHNGSSFDGRRENPGDESLLAAIRDLVPNDTHRSLDLAWATASPEEAIEQVFSAVRSDNRYQIITLDGADHGRTLACRSAGGRMDLRDDIGPVVAGFVHVDAAAADPAAALKSAVNDRTAAILLPVIATAGGGHHVTGEMFSAAAQIADQASIPLIIDHTQTPVGCTGKLMALDGIQCDAVLFSSGLFAGLPGGVIWCRSDFGPRGFVPHRPAQAMVAGEVLRRIKPHLSSAFSAESIQGFVVELAQTMSEAEVIEDIVSTGTNITLKLAIDAADFSGACDRCGLAIDIIGDDVAMLSLPINLVEDDFLTLQESFRRIAGWLAPSAV